LTNSTVVSADIKNDELVNVDINSAAAIVSTKLAPPAIRTLSQAIAVGDFTDNTNTTGYVDLSTQIPDNAMVLGWKFAGSGAFAGDTTAVMQVGVAGVLARFSADTAQSVFTAVTVGSCSLAASSFTTAATTVRVTVTGNSDFGLIVTNAAGAGTITLYYVITE